MKKTRGRLLRAGLVALGLWGARSALALDWPSPGWTPRCQRCHRPLTGISIPAPPPPGWPVEAGIPYPGRCCPSGVVCEPPVCPVPGAPAPPSAVPGAPQAAPAAPQAAGPSAAPGAAQPPSAMAPSPEAPGAAEAAAPATASGLGGGVGAPEGGMVMFGDLSPFGPGGFVPPPPPVPPGNPTPTPTPPTPRPPFPPGQPLAARPAPTIRSFKFADNQTPMPVNRFFFTFNYFDNVAQSVNQRAREPLGGLQAYRYVFGFEKTFWDQNASVGIVLPLNNLSANQSAIPGLGGTSTSVGDLSVYFKYALWIDRPKGRVLSTGLAITTPTGPASFAGASYLKGIHFTDLQPYLGFQWAQGRWYFIGFSAISVPTSARDVTIMYNDLAVGYFVYRNPDPQGWLRGVAPTFETHVNTPFNHHGVFNVNDLAGSAYVVNLTYGLNTFIANRTVLSMGLVTPVTGPRPFTVEALAFLNVFF